MRRTPQYCQIEDGHLPETIFEKDVLLYICHSFFFVAGPSSHFTRYNHINQHETDTTATEGNDFDSMENHNPQKFDNNHSVFSLM